MFYNTTTKKKTGEKIKKNKAFILIETFVAISILLLCVPAVLGAIQKGVNIGYYAKDELIASYLAQEGLEIIRSKRDNNMLSLSSATPPTPTISWLKGIDVCGAGLGCIVDIGFEDLNGPTVKACTSASCDGKLYQNSFGIYAHKPSVAGWTPTKFKRTVKVVSVVLNPCVEKICPEEVNVTSTVTYVTTFGTSKVIVTEDLYNWLKP